MPVNETTDEPAAAPRVAALMREMARAAFERQPANCGRSVGEFYSAYEDVYRKRAMALLAEMDVTESTERLPDAIEYPDGTAFLIEPESFKAGVLSERARIVAWLRAVAAGGEVPSQIAIIAIRQLADEIQEGAHER